MRWWAGEEAGRVRRGLRSVLEAMARRRGNRGSMMAGGGMRVGGGPGGGSWVVAVGWVVVVWVFGAGWSSVAPQSCHSHSGAAAGIEDGAGLSLDFGVGFVVSGRSVNSSQLLPNPSASVEGQAVTGEGD